jgi:hypothetical protein
MYSSRGILTLRCSESVHQTDTWVAEGGPIFTDRAIPTIGVKMEGTVIAGRCEM